MNNTSGRLLGVLRLSALAIGLAFAAGGFSAHAHKAVTSPYTYNQQVFPILRDKCGQCHVEGGAAPMSLLAYSDASGGAYAWAQAMREALVAQVMPPWYVDATGPSVEHAHRLTSRELDILVTWASGGAPEGEPVRRQAPKPATPHWMLGQPDLILSMPAAHEVPANTLEDTFDVTLATNLTDTKWVKAADLLPGTPTMVRRATISVDDGPVLAVWEPGDDGTVTPAGTAFRLLAGARLRLRIFYKKPWQEEQEKKTDRSQIGLYFTTAPASGSGIDALTVQGGQPDGTGPLRFSATTRAPSRVLAIRPQLDRPYSSLEITAVAASGKRVPLLKLHAARPEWPRRYWLVDPVTLPAGTAIEVTGTPDDSDDAPPMKAPNVPLEVAIDFVPQ